LLYYSITAMANAFRLRTLTLFLGDIAILIFSLWLSLYLRTFSVPTETVFMLHFWPFSLIFLVSLIVFVIAGLYETRSVILARRAFSITLLVAQTFNVALAAAFFFLIPFFGIAPKTLLGIYLVVSFLLVLLWRVGIFPWLGLQKPERAILVGNTKEVHELANALNHAHRGPAHVAEIISPESATLADDITHAVTKQNARFIIADFTNPRVAMAFPEISGLLASGIGFFDALQLYETVFGRIPLSLLDERWFAQNISLGSYSIYDALKRGLDIIGSLVLGVCSLVLYPFLIAAIKLQDGGSIFYTQTRVGKNNLPIVMRKFRSMTGTDQGSEVLKSKHRVTPLGKILRKTRVDEIPQLWNVLIGDLSLIGPRPEFPALVEKYTQQIPFYNIRHIAKPGLSGWAQLYHDNHPHHGTEVEATKEKLSYDLYYLKYRSLALDITIGLKTIKKILTRSGV
jgi:lipopolysaccharide/colanic/teichoic acid biosynthesis glycosyltransferase